MNGRPSRWMRRVPVLLSLILLPLAACGDDDDGAGPDNALARFVGTWQATSMVVTSVQDPSLSLDATLFGVTFSLTVHQGGNVTIVQGEPGETPEMETGVMVIESSSRLRLELENEEEVFRFTYQFSDGDRELTIVSLTPVEMDMDDDGVDEDVDLTLVLRKQT